LCVGWDVKPYEISITIAYIQAYDTMKLCEKYGFATSARDKHSAIFEYVRLSVT